jgi:hypothetical protein
LNPGSIGSKFSLRENRRRYVPGCTWKDR